MLPLETVVVTDVLVSRASSAVESVRLFFMWWPYTSIEDDMINSVREFTAMNMALKKDSRKSSTSRITVWHDTKHYREKKERRRRINTTDEKNDCVTN